MGGVIKENQDHNFLVEGKKTYVDFQVITAEGIANRKNSFMLRIRLKKKRIDFVLDFHLYHRKDTVALLKPLLEKHSGTTKAKEKRVQHSSRSLKWCCTHL